MTLSCLYREGLPPNVTRGCDQESGDRSQENTPTAGNSLQGNLLTPDSRLLSPSSEVETLLIQSIIRDGEKVIYEHVEADDGGFVDLTVAQYVDYDLGQDNIRFSNELYNQILDEAVAHSGEPVSYTHLTLPTNREV